MENKRYKYAVILANHWSFTGIGWQLGIESCRASVEDSLNLADKDPAVKVCINLDARAYAAIRKYYPETADRLSKYLKEGKTEIVGGTYGQPMGSMMGNESVIRQITEGRKAVKEAVGYDMVSFLEEEEFTFPQLPQILVKSGYKYASLAQCDTWGKVGVPVMNETSVNWTGKDGSAIPSVTKSPLYFHPPAVTEDVNGLLSEKGREKLETMKKYSAYPAVTVWTEFGWESMSEHNINKFHFENYENLKNTDDVDFVTIKEYFEKRKETDDKSVYIAYDDFNKLLPWGVGADQIRRFDRVAEYRLLLAEKLNVMAWLSGKPDRSDEINDAWKDLLISQSHDVSLCEYSRWGGGVMPDENRAEEFYGQQWGAIGYRHLDNSLNAAKRLTENLSAAVGSEENVPFDYEKAIVVYNMSQYEGKGEYHTGRIYLGEDVFDTEVRDSEGNPVPYNTLNSYRRENGSLYYTELVIESNGVPPFGVKSYYVCKGAGSEAKGSLIKENERCFTLENGKISAAIDKTTGYLTSLVCKETGENTVGKGTFRFHGEPSDVYPLWTKDVKIPYLSSSDAEVAVTVKKVFDTAKYAKIVSEFRHRQFFYFVTYELADMSDGIDVKCRLKIYIPPKAAEGKINGWQLPLEITDGYKIDFDVELNNARYYADAPFEITQTNKTGFHATHFVDIAGDKTGLTVIHGGNQYFKRTGNGIENLIHREWESHFTAEVDWLHYTEFTYTLIPHAAPKSYPEVFALTYGHICKPFVSVCEKGKYDRGFINAEGCAVSSMRKTDKGIEVRVFNPSDGKAAIKISPRFDFENVYITDLNGEIQSKQRSSGAFIYEMTPWEILTVLFA
ncbi:MAG: hypothetical protein IJU84_06645 [Clostridia bacterium]|nr:hypothetical protein [Clostridia bacterium]